MHRLSLRLCPGALAICQLPPDTPLADLPASTGFCSVTRTPSELSVVLPDKHVPAEWKAVRGWRYFQVAGPLSFEMTGVLAALATPLAEADISIFALSTFDTDYLLVRQERVARAVEVLTQAGHLVENADAP